MEIKPSQLIALLFGERVVPWTSGFSGSCPVQMEAASSSGLYFYFRSRGKTASLYVFENFPKPFASMPKEAPIWEGSLQSWEFPMAGWLTDNDALYALYMLLKDAQGAIAE